MGIWKWGPLSKRAQEGGVPEDSGQLHGVDPVDCIAVVATNVIGGAVLYG